MTDPDLIKLAIQMVQTEAPKAAADDEGSAPEQPQKAEVQPPPIPAAPSKPGLVHASAVKGVKTAEELAAMVLADVRGLKDCPKTGVKVTVYGSNPWNSWLSFGAAAGPVRNKADLQGFCEIITERLKRLYDVSS